MDSLPEEYCIIIRKRLQTFKRRRRYVEAQRKEEEKMLKEEEERLKKEGWLRFQMCVVMVATVALGRP